MTADVSQFPIGLLNKVYENISFISFTDEVFQDEILPLKEFFTEKALVIFVTKLVSQSGIEP